MVIIMLSYIFCSVSQIGAAKWRANRFQLIETRVDNLQRETLFRSISDSVQQAWLASLDPLPGSLDALPAAFIADIEAILGNAYEWRRVVKVEVAKYDLEPFTVQPLSPYDPHQMEPFERMRTQVAHGQPIVSSVSLGLVATTVLKAGRVSHVQFKTKVLVEEWLSKPSSASTLQMNGGGPPVTLMSAISSLLCCIVGNRPAPDPPVPSIQDTHYQTSHHTDVIPGNPPKIDSSLNQGGSPVEAEPYMSPPYLRQLLGSAGRGIQGEEAAELGSKVHLVCHHLKPDIMRLMLKFAPSI